MEELEIKEKIEETEKGHEKSQSSKLRIGLLIAALAALLALLEAGGKSAQTEAVNANLQASDLWAFFQAKTARVTTIQTAVESAKLSLLGDLPADQSGHPETDRCLECHCRALRQRAANWRRS
jgi:uncharacterized protein DUF4337